MEYLKCAVCSTLFDEPQELECLHVFCSNCIKRELLDTERNCVLCHICQKPTDPLKVCESQVRKLALQANSCRQTSLPKDEDGINEVETLVDNIKHGVRLAMENSMNEVSGHKECLRGRITEFYHSLISDLTSYLEEQCSDILNELETIFEGYDRESSKGNGRRQRVLEDVETVFKLFSEIYTNRANPIMEDFRQGIITYLGRCRRMMDDIKSMRCDVRFLAGHEQRDLILSSNFGAIVNQSQNPELRPSTYDETDESGQEMTPTNQYFRDDNTEEVISVHHAGQDGIDHTAENVPSHQHVTQTPQIANIRMPNDSLTNETQTSRIGQISSRNIEISTQSPSGDLSAVSDQMSRNLQLIDRNDEEQPPSYWEAVAESETDNTRTPQFSFNLSQEPQSREQHLLSSTRTLESSTTGLSSPRRTGQRNRVPQRIMYREDSVHVIHTSSPLQYATHARSIRTQLPDDTRSGPIVGIAWLQDKLVLVDRFNSKIKMFTETGEFLHSLKFMDGEPWDVCTVNVIETTNNPLTCATTVPRQKLVMLIQIMEGRMLLIRHRIATRKGYVCIAYDQKNGCLVCGVSSPFGTSGIDVINTGGILLAQFPLPPQVLVRSIDVSIKDTIIICDWRKNTVTFLSKTGARIGQYSGSEQYPLLEPVGTCTDGRGFLFVADSKSNTIHILTMEGMLYGTVKSSCPIIRPKEINVRPDGPPKLALSHGSMYVEVFNLFESSDTAPTVTPSAPNL